SWPVWPLRGSTSPTRAHGRGLADGEDDKVGSGPPASAMNRVSPILVREETLDPSYLPPRLVRRDTELELLRRRYREGLAKGLPYHLLVTGGIGSGKTALVRRLASDLERAGRLGGFPVKAAYINCWRRASDRTVMLDEASSLVRQETKLVYLLSRSREVELGSISLVLVAAEDLFPYLDPASRSSFGVTHRLSLAPYDRAALTDILESRAELALRPGSFEREILDQIARIAAPN